MTRLAAAVFALATVACSEKQPEDKKPEPMSAAEVKRDVDACKAYVDRVCACADKVPAAKDACGLARAMPDAIQLQLSLAQAPETKGNDILKAHAGIRKVVKECIEQTAQLPALGCP